MGGAPRPERPRGLAARVRPSRAILPPSSTAVVLEPSLVLADDVRELNRFVRAGGRLIAGGTDVYWLRPIVGTKLAAKGSGVRRRAAARPRARGGGRDRTSSPTGMLRGRGSPGRSRCSGGAAGRSPRWRTSARDGWCCSPTTRCSRTTFSAGLSNARFSLDIAGPPRREIVFYETYPRLRKGDEHGTLGDPAGLARSHPARVRRSGRLHGRPRPPARASRARAPAARIRRGASTSRRWPGSSRGREPRPRRSGRFGTRRGGGTNMPGPARCRRMRRPPWRARR